MTTFADYIESKPAMEEKVSNIEHYTVMLCDALYVDKKRWMLELHNGAIDRGENVEYHKNQIAEINNNGVDTEFYIKPGGRKYHKIMMRSGPNGSVHCFVDKKTGDVYKPASLNAPAKGIRYNLLDDNSREECFARCDWAGGYLYM